MKNYTKNKENIFNKILKKFSSKDFQQKENSFSNFFFKKVIEKFQVVFANKEEKIIKLKQEKIQMRNNFVEEFKKLSSENQKLTQATTISSNANINFDCSSTINNLLKKNSKLKKINEKQQKKLKNYEKNLKFFIQRENNMLNLLTKDKEISKEIEYKSEQKFVKKSSSFFNENHLSEEFIFSSNENQK